MCTQFVALKIVKKITQLKSPKFYKTLPNTTALNYKKINKIITNYSLKYIYYLPWSISHVIHKLLSLSSKNCTPSWLANKGMYSIIAKRTRHLGSSASSTIAGKSVSESYIKRKL